MDGFTGFKTAATKELPDAMTVMDPFHVLRLADDTLDVCYRRVQQHPHGRREQKNDPLYKARRALHTGAGLLTDRQQARLEALFPLSEHIEAEATRGIYQRMITTHHEPDRQLGNKTMHAVINTPTTSAPATLIDPQHLSRTLKKHTTNILTFSDHPDTPNTPTEAINRPLKHPHESTPDSRNPTNHNTRPLLKTSSFKPHPHPQIRRACFAVKVSPSA